MTVTGSEGPQLVRTTLPARRSVEPSKKTGLRAVSGLPAAGERCHWRGRESLPGPVQAGPVGPETQCSSWAGLPLREAATDVPTEGSEADAHASGNRHRDQREAADRDGETGLADGPKAHPDPAHEKQDDDGKGQD